MSALRDRLRQLFFDQGSRHYGEGVSQREHALQCAMLAEEAGARPALITAALLHDLGHLLHPDADAARAEGVDDRHEAIGARWLADHFLPQVWKPVALHVQAKRFLCAIEADYHASLSDASKHSLQLQGGVMDPVEADRFRALTHALDAVALRRWDDGAKRANEPTPDLDHYLAIAQRCRLDD